MRETKPWLLFIVYSTNKSVWLSDYEPNPANFFVFISLLVSFMFPLNCAEIKLNNFEIFLVRARVLLQLFIEIFQNSQNEHFNTRTYVDLWMRYFITKKIDIFVLNIIPSDTTKILSKCHGEFYLELNVFKINILTVCENWIQQLLFYLFGPLHICKICYCESSRINCKKGNQ